MSQQETYKDSVRQFKDFIEHELDESNLVCDLYIMKYAVIEKNKTQYKDWGDKVFRYRAFSLSKINKKGLPSSGLSGICKLEFEKYSELSCILASLFGIRIPISNAESLEKILPALAGKKFFGLKGQSRYLNPRQDEYLVTSIYKVLPYIPYPDMKRGRLVRYTTTPVHPDYVGAAYLERQETLAKKIAKIYKKQGLKFHWRS